VPLVSQLIGPPGAGKSQIARAIAYRLWRSRGRDVSERHGAPFYGFVELQPGPSSDEFFFRYDYVPVAGSGGQVALVDSAFVQAMREGWVVMIDEVNTARDVALLSINATLDGRLTLYLAATGETVVAKPGFAVLLAYNPGARRCDRHPGRVALPVPRHARGHEQLGRARRARRPGVARRGGDAP
jgi:MoxR-like ATPase